MKREECSDEMAGKLEGKQNERVQLERG